MSTEDQCEKLNNTRALTTAVDKITLMAVTKILCPGLNN